jgi:tetratricopeptide (TPR) repeat protein
MSGEALYERYKDALRRGHVASLRGRLEEALTAYAEAAAIAPERATPHTSAGTALMRRKRPADAVRHYTTAIRLSPHDEAALLGRAQALTAMNRRPQAADAYDAAADALAASGKLADAVDAARRGLELAEGRERRRTLEQLIERLRASDPAEPGRVALERALVVLEGPAVEARRQPPPAHAKSTPAKAAAVAPVEPPVKRHKAAPTLETAPEAVQAAEAAEATEVVAVAAPAGSVATDAPPVEEAAGPVEAESAPEPVPAPRRALDRDLPPDLDLAELALAAEGTLERRVQGVGLDQLLDLASAYRRDGHAEAALDTCYLALSIAPDDLSLHLALVELYDERGWSTLATEKLDLLDRLAALDADESHRALLAGTRGARGQGGPPGRS